MTRRPLLVQALCCALLLNMIGVANVGVVLPAMAEEMQLTASQAGLLGGAFFAAYAIGVPLIVPLTDRVSPLAVYLVGSVCWMAGGVLCAVTTGGMLLPLAGRALSGLGMAATYMPGMVLLVTRMPERMRASASATYTSCITLGNSVCFAVIGAIALYFPWQAAFLVAAGAAALALPLVLFSVRAAPSAETGNQRPEQVSSITFLVRPRLLGLLAAFAGNAWEAFAFRTWWITFLVFCNGAEPNGRVFAQLAIITAVTGLIAMPFSVLVARNARGTRRVPILFSVCAASAAFSLVPPALAASSLPLVIAVTTVYLCLIFADSGSLPPALLEESPPSRRGAALAAAATAGNAGAFCGVATVGLVLELAGGPSSAAAWVYAFGTMGIGSLAGGLILWVTHRPARKSEPD